MCKPFLRVRRQMRECERTVFVDVCTDKVCQKSVHVKAQRKFILPVKFTFLTNSRCNIHCISTPVPKDVIVVRLPTITVPKSPLVFIITTSQSVVAFILKAQHLIYDHVPWCWSEFCVVFKKMFVDVIPFFNISHTWTRHNNQWRAVYLRSVLRLYGFWRGGIFIVPHLMRYGSQFLWSYLKDISNGLLRQARDTEYTVKPSAPWGKLNTMVYLQ